MNISTNRSIFAFLFLFAGLFNTTYAAAGHNAKMFSVASANTVDEAVTMLSERLESQGFEITLVVNHSAAAASVGLDLPDTQVIFARPPAHFEHHLLNRSSTIGLDVPFKYLVFKAENDQIRVQHNSIGYLINRHRMKMFDFPLRILDKVTSQFSNTETGIITIESNQDRDSTVQSLQDAISSNPAFRIPLVLDFSNDETQRNGPVLVVFGNPNAGTPMMQQQRSIAIDLPQKMLVWEDRHGKVFISYNDPFFIADRHDLQGLDTLLQNISNALSGFATAGATP